MAGAPELPLGADIANGAAGEPAFYSGRLLNVDGAPIAGGMLDVWSGDGEGTYDLQMPDQTEMLCRGRFRTDAEGRYWFRSIRPTFYPVPTDGPVGDMLRKMGRQPNRPGHIHMIVSAPGYETVVTHLFVAGTPYLDSDPVFAVKDSLIVEFERHEPGVTPGRRADRRALLHLQLRFPSRPDVIRRGISRTGHRRRLTWGRIDPWAAGSLASAPVLDSAAGPPRTLGPSPPA